MAFLTNLTLWKKITLLTVLGLLLGVGIFSTLSLRAVNQATETMLQERLTTARLVADYIDETLSLALNELKNSARAIGGENTIASLETQIDALDSTYERLLIHVQYIYFLNANGDIMWSKPWLSEIQNLDLASYPSISQTLKTNEPTISGLVSAPISNIPTFLLAAPVQPRRGVSGGVLVAAIDPAQSSIGGFVQPIRLGQTGYVEIVDKNGVVVLRTKPGPKLAPFEKSDHSGRFAALISAGEPTRGVCHTCHEDQTVERKDVLAFVPLTKADWGVVIRQSEEEALAPAHDLRQSLMLAGALVVTIALLFVVITTQNIGRRIQTLTTASKKIASGDLVSSVKTSGRDEVGVLAQTLDDMREKLGASYGDLEQKTKELSSMLSVSEILTSTFDLPLLLNAVVAKAVEVIPGADAGALLLETADQKSVQVQCVVGLENALSQSVISPESKPAGFPAGLEKGQKDLVKRAVGIFLVSGAFYRDIQSSIVAEVSHRNRHVGSLIILSFKDKNAFSESDRSLLQTIAHYIVIAIERTQLTKEAGEARALYETDRLRSQFISSVSHELRTPLTFIKGYSTSLLRQDVSWDSEARQEFLQIIDEKTDELLDMIDKLLQSAKLEAGALKLEKEPVLIPKVAARVVEEWAPRAKKYKFTLNFAPSFPVIEADARCVEQVIRNLVENAVKYSPEGGEITLAGEVKDDQVIVSVSDEGVGIPLQHQSKIFQRFYRVDNKHTRNAPGSGLGLFIAKGHVEAHGGNIWLESVVGKGSTFYFSLPLDQVESVAKGGEDS